MRKFLHIDHDGSIVFDSSPCLCSFGITEAISGFIAAGAADIGIGAETAATIGSIGAGALEGAGIGALTDPKNPLKGAEFGAITGGVEAGLAPVVSQLGLGGVGSGALAGAAGGALGGLATGRNPLTSAALGGVYGGIQGAITPSSGAATSGGPATNAAATAAPASLGPVSSVPSEVTITPAATDPAVAAASAGSLDAANISAGVQPLATPAPAAAAAAPGAVTPGATAASGGTGVGGWLKDNPWAVPAAGLAVSAIRGNQSLPGEKQLTADAGALNRNAAQLMSYYRSGTLPGGLQLGLNEAAAAAKASIRSSYAAAGDAGSSAEMQDMAAVDERKQAQGAQIALNLLQTGISEMGVADQLYLELMGNALQQDQALGQAFATFAAGLVPPTPNPAASGNPNYRGG